MYQTVNVQWNNQIKITINHKIYLNKLLIETSKLYATSLDDAKLFLSALYSKPLPKRGESINVTFGIDDVINQIKLFKIKLLN